MTEPAPLPERLRADLVAARKARDGHSVSALRTVLAALANAEAPVFDPARHGEGHGELREHARTELGPDEWAAVVRDEIARRLALIAEVGERAGPAFVADLEAEVAVLRRYVSRP